MDARRMNFVELCECAVAATRDVEDLCFPHVRSSEEQTLSFFRLFPNAATAHDFRTFLSTRSAAAQNFLLLFLSSGLRWRFFRASGRGQKCPLCPCSFWSWESPWESSLGHAGHPVPRVFVGGIPRGLSRTGRWGEGGRAYLGQSFSSRRDFFHFGCDRRVIFIKLCSRKICFLFYCFLRL